MTLDLPASRDAENLSSDDLDVLAEDLDAYEVPTPELDRADVVSEPASGPAIEPTDRPASDPHVEEAADRPGEEPIEPMVASVVEPTLPEPDPSEPGPFDAVPAALRPALEAKGFAALTSVQEAVLAQDAAGRDLQISSQTGSGKTVALGFALATALLEERQTGIGPEALIIVPTRELANQVCDELAWLTRDLEGTRVQAVTGGTPVFRDHKMLRTRPRVLVGTPGRLLDHVTSKNLDLSGIRELVLDEADQMLDMGFREELEGILDTTPDTRRTHMVSATFPQGILRLAQRYQSEPLVIEGTRLGDANQDIEHQGHLVSMRERYATMVNLLLQGEGERTLVFVERRADAADLAERLEGDGFRALPLSGELAQAHRERTLAAFRDGRAQVLVATDVAARGLDVPDVALVIHTAPPIDAQVYTHRSGRTGRAGKAGRSVLFASPNRRRKVERLLQEAGVDLTWCPVPDADEVHRQLRQRYRDALAKELDTALAKKPRNYLLEHAEQLLERYEAGPLVAALLKRIEPEQPGRPATGAARDDHRHQGGDRSHRPKWQGRDERGGRDRDRGPRSPRGGRFDAENAVRFFMNYGTNQGATPSRLLAAICRRGEVDGGSIGPIAIHPNAATFDVHRDVVERFERLAGRRDPRDPNVMIRRDRGPVGPPRGKRRG